MSRPYGARSNNSWVRAGLLPSTPALKARAGRPCTDSDRKVSDPNSPRSLRSRTPSDGEGKKHDPLFRGGIAQRGGGISSPTATISLVDISRNGRRCTASTLREMG